MSVPFTLGQFEASESFRKASIDEQVKARQRYFSDFVATDPNFLALAPQDRAVVADKVTRRAPVLEDETSSEVLALKGSIMSLKEKVAQGDQLGALAEYNSIGTSLALRSGFRESAVANILVGATDVVSELWNPGDALLKHTLGREGEKLDALAQEALATAGVLRPEALAALAEGRVGPNDQLPFMDGSEFGRRASVLRVASAIGEMIPIVGAVGTVGAAGKATGPLMKAIVKAAETNIKSQSLSRLAAVAGEQTVQGAAVALAATVGQLVQEVGDGTLGQDSIGTVAQRFGTEIGMNYAGWIALGAVGGAAKHVARLFGSDRLFGEAAEAAGGAVLPKGVLPNGLDATEFEARYTAHLMAGTDLAPELLNGLDAPTVEMLQTGFSNARAKLSNGLGNDEEAIAKTLAGAFQFDLKRAEHGLQIEIVALDGTVAATADSFKEATQKIIGRLGELTGSFKERTGTARFADSFKLSKDFVETFSASNKGGMKMLAQLAHMGGEKEYALVGEALLGKKLKAQVIPDLFEQVNSAGELNRLGYFVSGQKWEWSPMVLNGRVHDYVEKGILPLPAGQLDKISGDAYFKALAESQPGRLREAEFKAFTDLLFKTKGATSSMAQTSHIAIGNFAYKVWGGALLKQGDGSIVITKRVEKKGGSVWDIAERFDSYEEARAATYDKMLEEGRLNLWDITNAIESMSGLKVSREVTTFKAASKEGRDTASAVYVLRNKQGLLLSQHSSLRALIKENPDLGLKLRIPQEFAPKAYVVEDATKLRRIKYEGTLASGRLIDMLDLANEYAQPGVTRQFKSTFMKFGGHEAESYLLDGKRVFSYSNGATTRTASSLDDLSRQVASDELNLADLSKAADERGFSAIFASDGRLHLVDADGSYASFGTRKEAEQFFEEHAPLRDAPELTGIPVTDDMVAIADKAALEAAPKAASTGIRSVLGSVYRGIFENEAVSALAAPTRSHLAMHAARTKDPRQFNTFVNMTRLKQLANAETATHARTIRQMFGSMSTARKDVLNQLRVVPRSVRPKMARSMGIKLNEGDLELLERSEDYMKAFCQAHGLGGLESYIGRSSRTETLIRRERIRNGEKLPLNADDLLKRDYQDGQIPPFVKEFTEGMSTGDLLHWNGIASLDEWMTATVDKVVRAKYFKPMREEIILTWDHVVKANKAGRYGKGGNAVQAYFETMVNEAFGVKTGAAQMEARAVGTFMEGISSYLEKIPIARELGVAQEMKFSSLIGKLGEIFTYNSQAWRLWGMPRNLAQNTYLGATIGFSAMLKAWHEVLNDPRIIDDLVLRGKFPETIASVEGGANGALGRLKTLGMRPTEIADNLTRAICFRAAQNEVERFSRRVAAKAIDLNAPNARKVLAEELQIDWLPDAEVERIRLMISNKAPLANVADEIGEIWQRKTMYAYEKEAQGYIGRGLIGKVFNKLGVFSTHTISLYKDVLTNGSASGRAIRAARFASAAAALTAASTAAGISYSGFLLTDPFTFSGGPYWTAMNNALNAWGDRPENAVARSQFVRNVPRMVAPGVMLASQAPKAQAGLDEGGWEGLLRVFYAASSVPTPPLEK